MAGAVTPRSRPATAQLRRTSAEERDAVAETLGLAFHDDPVMAWWIGDDADRARILPGFFDLALSAQDPGLDETWTADDLSAVASWMAPESWHPTTEEELGELVPRYFEVLGERYMERGATILGLVEAVHPLETHWYLPFLGTLPDRQGRGLGSALLAHMGERLDGEGLPAYLESSSARSRALYLRHGFEVTGEIVLPGGPSIWPMWREPRTA
ncbi:MAG: GNAT family N-acetyltransferase [Actinomycetota bacterium]